MYRYMESINGKRSGEQSKQSDTPRQHKRSSHGTSINLVDYNTCTDTIVLDWNPFVLIHVEENEKPCYVMYHVLAVGIWQHCTVLRSTSYASTTFLYLYSYERYILLEYCTATSWEKQYQTRSSGSFVRPTRLKSERYGNCALVVSNEYWVLSRATVPVRVTVE